MSAITITNAGLNLWRNGSSGADNPQITYFAVGSGTNAPTVNDTSLQSEQFRKAVTSYTNGASSGELLVNCYLAPGDAVGIDIEEVGVYGGSSASSTPNSGILIARGLYSHNPKQNTESIQIQLDLTF